MGITQILYGIEKEYQEEIIEKYLNQGGEERRQEYREFDDIACKVLEKERHVTLAANMLIRMNKLKSRRDFPGEFKTGRKAKGENLQTPAQYLKARNIKTRHMSPVR